MLKPPTGEKTVPTIGDPRGGAPRPLASRRELRMIMLGVFALIFVVVWFATGQVRRPTGIIEPSPLVAIKAMGRPDWQSLGSLPGAVEIAEARASLESILREGQVPSVALGLDATALAWAERMAAQDVERRRIPQRVTAAELVHDEVRTEQLVSFSARLDEVVAVPIEGREAGYRWLGLALDDDQYAIALAPDDGRDLTINAKVQILARYMGRTVLNTSTGDARVPCLFARVVTPVDEGAEDAPLGLAEFQGQAILPDDLYADLDDELPIIETRAYYLTLGRHKAELGTPEIMGEAKDGNKIANDMHQNPGAHRGQLVTVRGVVYRAWEDTQIAKDRPFDVRRVVRVQLYRRDWGPITEDGKTSTKNILRIFELACITDQPLPNTGDYIGATGRFLKWRAIPVETHPEMDRLLGVNRHSGKVYTCFIVAGAWHPETVQTVNMTPLVILLSVGGVCFVLFILWYINRDRGAERRLQASVTALRQQRRALNRKPGEAGADSGSEASKTEG